MITDYEKENKRRMYKISFVLMLVVILFLSCLFLITTVNATVTEYSYGLFNASSATVDAYKVFDSNPITYWQSAEGLPQWIKNDYETSSHVINNYNITAYNGGSGYNPISWLVNASNDDINYITIDAKTSQSFSSGETKYYIISNTNSYRYYKFIITNSQGTSVILAEIHLLYNDTIITPSPQPIFIGNIYPLYISKNSITWGVTSEFNVTQVSNDGVIILNYDNASKMFTENNLEPSTYHSFCITPVCNVIETLPENVKSSDLFFDFLVKYGLIILIIGLMFAGFKVPLVSIVGIIVAFIAFIAALPQGDFWMDIIYIVLLMGSTMVTYVGVRK